MSKMLSSSFCTGDELPGPAHQRPRSSMTRLTNFSISSIIGLTPSIKQHEPTTTTAVVEVVANTSADNRLQSIDNISYSSSSNSNSDSGSKQIKKCAPKNFQCYVCQMAFSNNGQLKSHVRIHTGERPFRCPELACGKTFTRNEELTRHKLIHTGIRPHVCPTCSKTFGRKDHLKKHLRTHENKKATTTSSSSSELVYASSACLMALTDGSGQDVLLTKSSPSPLQTSQTTRTPIRKQLQTTSEDTPMAAMTNLSSYSNQNQQPDPFTNTFLGDQIASLAALNSAIAMSSAAAATSVPIPIDLTQSNQLQQLAGNYWQEWYNFINYQQQQQQQHELYHPGNNDTN